MGQSLMLSLSDLSCPQNYLLKVNYTYIHFAVKEIEAYRNVIIGINHNTGEWQIHPGTRTFLMLNFRLLGTP